ncbi:MAG: Zn-ribbon domain-containing OB-fold protein [Armatimonadetes bacterium]|nr:Zn-ribbon domain-containing OB-fold protein [Armatimonadota bacterium]
MGITEKINDLRDIKSWHGEMPVQYLYTYGIAGEKLFRAIKDEKKFLATKCPDCNFVYLPPRIYCQECFTNLENSWREVENKGEVHSFTIVYLDIENKPLDVPEVIALIRIKGTNGGFIHKLGEINPEKVNIGLEVKAVFKEKREGNILDIQYFKPV